MKWGRHRFASSSFHQSLLTRVLPVSWLSKLKQKATSATMKQNGNMKFSAQNSLLDASWREGRFYYVDNDDYWRLSFGDDRARRSTGDINSSRYGVDALELDRVMGSSFASLDLEEMETMRLEGNQNFDDTVSDIQKMKKKEYKKGILQGNDASKTNETLREGGNMNAENSRKFSLQELKRRSNKDEEEHVLETKTEKTVQAKNKTFKRAAASNTRKQGNFSSPNSAIRMAEEDCEFKALNFEVTNATSGKILSSDLKKLKDENSAKDITPKCESQRESIYITSEPHIIRKTKKKGRLKEHSPRTECNIQTSEDANEAKMKIRRETKDKPIACNTIFDSFAVVKSSFNPQSDFRDSMMEMITEKDIRQPDELEELLTCYLTFNCNVYHDLIIKVFQQVWFELKC